MPSTGFLLASLFFTAVTIQGAHAQDFWTFKNWNVSIEQADSTEDNYKNCVIYTGGDGLPTVSAEFFSGDAGPPHSYPQVMVKETTYRGIAPMIKNGDQINLVFDDGDSVVARAEAGVDDTGHPFAHGFVPFEDNILVLQAMQRNGELSVTVPAGTLTTVPLSGFTAAYLKMSEICGFSTEGVID